MEIVRQSRLSGIPLCPACGKGMGGDVWPHASLTRFVAGSPIVINTCSLFCAFALERREREVIESLPVRHTEKQVAELYPDAFRKTTVGNYVPPAKTVPNGRESKRGFPEPRMKWDLRKGPLDWLADGTE